MVERRKGVYTSEERRYFDEKDRRVGRSLVRERKRRREDGGTAAEGECLRKMKGARETCCINASDISVCHKGERERATALSIKC